MSADPRVRDLVDQLLDSDASPEEVCNQCPELLPEVQNRWQRVRRLRGDLDALFPPEGSDRPADDTILPQVPGYLVEGLLGRGGMGVAYKARDLALDRDVAVKLLQTSYPADSPVARRFTDEATITAQLQHPGVPPVYRVGVLPDGRPFLAMKLIMGRTLAALLGERTGPAADRGRFVATFEQVCHAVGYAHAHNVIHRDLKPSNVMVGEFGEVQVMDWGLAKVLTDRGRPPSPPDTALDTAAGSTIRPSRDANHVTQAGSLLGTPAYMPPEQATGAVDRVDARSDVFSLGGVLCAVLTGRPPYAADTAEATRRLAARARLDDAHARLAACGAEPGLVTLCLRCLAPEPDDRPRDAGEVAAAVTALRAAAEERARRAELDSVRAAEQGKRRRVLLAASGAVVVVLLAGLGVSLWQMVRATAAETTAKENEATANKERDAKAKALEAETKARQQAFAALRSMTAEAIERKFGQGVSLTENDRAFLRGIIAQFDAFAAINGDDTDSRAVRAEGRYRVGTIHYRLGEFHEALQDYDQALSIYERLAADSPSQPEFRHDLARCHSNRGTLLRHTGRLQEAVQDFDRAVSIHTELVADFPARPEFRHSLAISYNNRGAVLFAAGRIQEAERDLDQAQSIYKQLADDFPSQPEFRTDLAASHSNRGVLQSEIGGYKDALEHFDHAVTIRKQLVDDFPSQPEFRDQLATSHRNRARLLYVTGQLPEAERDNDQSLSIFKQLAGDFPSRPDYRLSLAKSYIGRSALLRRSDQFKDAEQEYDQALSFLKQLSADFPNRPEIQKELALAHNQRANLLTKAGRLKEAERAYDQALRIQRQQAADFPDQPDPRHDLADTCLDLALLHMQLGNVAAAKRLLLEGGPHDRAALQANPRHQDYRKSYRNLLGALTAVHTGLLEQEDAVRTAETCRDLGWDGPADAYYAASVLSRCVPIVAKHAHLDTTRRAAAVKFYGDAAMKLLRHAVSKGYTDVANLKKNAYLDPLRQRDDFRTLVAELEGKGK